jgi:hypothetical protein
MRNDPLEMRPKVGTRFGCSEGRKGDAVRCCDPDQWSASNCEHLDRTGNHGRVVGFDKSLLPREQRLIEESNCSIPPFYRSHRRYPDSEVLNKFLTKRS